jgi:hypothetical protein
MVWAFASRQFAPRGHLMGPHERFKWTHPVATCLNGSQAIGHMISDVDRL